MSSTEFVSQTADHMSGGEDVIEPEGFLEYDIDSQGGVELTGYIPPDRVGEAVDEASGVD